VALWAIPTAVGSGGLCPQRASAGRSNGMWYGWLPAAGTVMYRAAQAAYGPLFGLRILVEEAYAPILQRQQSPVGNGTMTSETTGTTCPK